MPGQLPQLEQRIIEKVREEVKQEIKQEKEQTIPRKLPLLGKKQEEYHFTIQKNTTIPNLPDVPKELLDVKYPLLEPYAYAHLKWDPASGEIVYNLEEPYLQIYEKKVLNLLEEGIKELLNISFLSTNEGENTIQYLEKNVRALLNELRINLEKESYLKIMYYIYRDFVGLGKIEPLMNDYFIEDIECNGANYPIYVVHRKFRNLRTTAIFNKIEELSDFVEKLAQKAGQYISYANPLLDGALPDGSRVNATFTEDISSRGPSFTIRKFTKEPWSPVKLIELGSLSPEILAYLWIAIEHEQNVMIIGGTGCGKTTILNALTFFIPPQSRIVSIEDTRELNLEHSNWLPSVAREGVGLANLVGQKYGAVSLFNLLKESFRQRPDYVIVGEIRGEEAYVLFQGMASGHPSFGTMHADSLDTMIKRLTTPPINLSSSLVETMDVVLIMANIRTSKKSLRKLKEIVEVISVNEDKTSKSNVPFRWNPNNDTFERVAESFIFNKVVEASGVPREIIEQEYELRTRLIYEMYKRKIYDFHEVQQTINDYYKNSKNTLKKFGIIK